jgi:nitrogen regulatory protein P-II 1
VAKIEIVCNDSDVTKIIEIISMKGRTGNPGDGIIYVSGVEKAVRVKTGKEDDRDQFKNGF